MRGFFWGSGDKETGEQRADVPEQMLCVWRAARVPSGAPALLCSSRSRVLLPCEVYALSKTLELRPQPSSGRLCASFDGGGAGAVFPKSCLWRTIATGCVVWVSGLGGVQFVRC
jgi:hypothetical protein